MRFSQPGLQAKRLYFGYLQTAQGMRSERPRLSPDHSHYLRACAAPPLPSSPARGESEPVLTKVPPSALPTPPGKPNSGLSCGLIGALHIRLNENLGLCFLPERGSQELMISGGKKWRFNVGEVAVRRLKSLSH